MLSVKYFPPNSVVSDITRHVVRTQAVCSTYIPWDGTFISLYQCMSRRKRWFPPVKFRPTPPASNETNITFKGQKRVKEPVSRKLVLHILHIIIWTRASVYHIYITCVFLLCFWELTRCSFMRHRSLDMEVMAQRGQPTIPYTFPWSIFTDYRKEWKVQTLCPTQTINLSDDSLLPTMGSISTNSKLTIMIT